MSEAPTTAIAPIAGAQPKSALIAFGNDGLQLNTMEQAFIFAKAVIGSGLAPKAFQTPEAVLIAVQMGAEIGLPPMAALQNIALINGKPGVYGDMGKGMLRARGFDIEETCDATKATCTISHPRQKPVTRVFSIDDAKKAGLWGKAGPWSQYPHRMLAWRAFWFAARDAAADVLKGVGGAEEMRDNPPEKNVTNTAPIPQAQRLSIVDAAPEVVTETAAPETAAPAETQAASDPEAAADQFEGGDRHSLIDLIEGMMLDRGVTETKLAAEAVKAGFAIPANSKKLADLSDETLVFMRDYLRGAKK